LIKIADVLFKLDFSSVLILSNKFALFK